MNCPNCNDEMQKLEPGSFSHSNNSCPLAYRPWSAYEVKIIGDTIAAAQRDNPWKTALEQAAIVSWTLTATNKDDPARMLADLLEQARRETLDTQVSQAAAQLVAIGRRDALDQAAQFVENRLSAGIAGAYLAAEIRALPNPYRQGATAAPACPVCGEPMQRGSVWLCVKDGQTVIV